MASTATVNQDILLTATWATFYAQVAAGNQQLVLPDNLPSSIITTIHNRYSNLINGPVSVVPVPSLNIIRFTPYAGTTSTTMTPTVASPASASPSGAREPKGKAKVPRPPNAFILYRQQQHPVIKEAFPGIVNNDISKKVAAMWKDESEEVKAVWKAKADAAKEQHLKQHPGYSYQPRKPSEKKRRMTKRKAAVLQNLASIPTAGNDNQMTSTPQLPLPSFSTLPDNPMLMEFTLSQGPAAIETLGQMIDQHNNSQLVFDFTNTPAAVSSDGFANVTSDYAIADALIPPGQIDHVLEQRLAAEFVAGNAEEMDETELFSSLAELPEQTSEQARQQQLGEEVFGYGMFGSEPWVPF